MKLFTLFVAYDFGGHYNTVHTSLEGIVDVIHEIAKELPIDDELPKEEHIQKFLDEDEEYYREFSDGTWIHIQELSEKSTSEIIEKIKEEG